MPKKKSAGKKKVKSRVKKAKKSIKKKVQKRKSISKRAKKKSVSRKPKTVKTKANVLGVVTHYFPHVQAAVVKVKKTLALNDSITIKGHTTNFTQRIESMQIDHTPVLQAKKGDEIGLQVIDRTREGDLVLGAE